MHYIRAQIGLHKIYQKWSPQSQFLLFSFKKCIEYRAHFSYADLPSHTRTLCMQPHSFLIGAQEYQIRLDYSIIYHQFILFTHVTFSHRTAPINQHYTQPITLQNSSNTPSITYWPTAHNTSNQAYITHMTPHNTRPKSQNKSLTLGQWLQDLPQNNSKCNVIQQQDYAA